MCGFAVKAELLFTFDLHDLAFMNDNLNRPKANPLHNLGNLICDMGGLLFFAVLLLNRCHLCSPATLLCYKARVAFICHRA